MRSVGHTEYQLDEPGLQQETVRYLAAFAHLHFCLGIRRTGVRLLVFPATRARSDQRCRCPRWCRGIIGQHGVFLVVERGDRCAFRWTT